MYMTEMKGKEMLQDINSEEFKQLILEEEKLVLVDFYAEWCNPCKTMVPVLRQVVSEHKEELNVYRLDIEKNPDIALEYRVLSIPTLLIFKKGKLTGKIEGSTTKAAIDQKLKRYI